jgi:hypothetical protein
MPVFQQRRGRSSRVVRPLDLPRWLGLPEDPQQAAREGVFVLEQ